ncbi:GTP-binding protein [Sinomonas sp. ASV322]|uniref:CobW family GTP-binding protein n=1 Tax=Sinomonas sp. ASV322 TaxID=3041920 RepID=UPI0027DB3645|nr:GTP-binding protein [Sinomonas sp. ASV322]MDQ4502790.1 GTP-binding protein [Sinomonas sp. ASV322]
MRKRADERIPVIALTGYLGAGKTTVLNHLLRQPGARVGVIVNDFGDINVDAGLVSGQIDEPASISGGCVCCLPDGGGLDEALERLAHPRLALDVVIVEASGIAQPGSLARLIRYSGVETVRAGGVVDVVDAVEYFRTVDTGALVPARFSVASLVVLNKCDELPGCDREETLARIERRIREGNPDVHIVRTSHGRVDPSLVYDVASFEDPEDQLPIGALLRAAHESLGHDSHEHVRAVSVRSAGGVDPGRVVELLEAPPASAYRLKGRIAVRSARGIVAYVVNVVGRSIHVARAAGGGGAASELVAIGMDLDEDDARACLERALEPSAEGGRAGLERLRRLARLSG